MLSWGGGCLIAYPSPRVETPTCAPHLPPTPTPHPARSLLARRARTAGPAASEGVSTAGAPALSFDELRAMVGKMPAEVLTVKWGVPFEVSRGLGAYRGAPARGWRWAGLHVRCAPALPSPPPL